MIGWLFAPYPRTADDYELSWLHFYAAKKGWQLPDPPGDLTGLDARIAQVEDKLGAANCREARAALVDDLYKNLNTLDGKASGLLGYCGLILAGASLLLGSRDSPLDPTLIYVGVILAGLAAFCALEVVFVRWTSPRGLRGRTLRDACRTDYITRTTRTRIYLTAWGLVIAATASFVLLGLAGLVTGAA